MNERIPIAGGLAALWGVVGVLGLLSQALLRLAPRAVEAVIDEPGLSAFQWVVLATWTVFNMYGEGYRAFHKRFSPRVVARALHLAKHPKPLHVALAPFFCMSLFHATKRGKIVAWGTTIMVLCFIVLLRRTPQPWRGIVDAGVVAALLMGALSIVYHYARALAGTSPSVHAALPDAI